MPATSVQHLLLISVAVAAPYPGFDPGPGFDPADPDFDPAGPDFDPAAGPDFDPAAAPVVAAVVAEACSGQKQGYALSLRQKDYFSGHFYMPQWIPPVDFLPGYQLSENFKNPIKR